MVKKSVINVIECFKAIIWALIVLAYNSIVLSVKIPVIAISHVFKPIVKPVIWSVIKVLRWFIISHRLLLNWMISIHNYIYNEYILLFGGV
jgi:hypothetical protein